MKNTRMGRGFTLIELVIVIAILGILMAIAVPAFNSVSKSARASQARAFAAQLNTYVQGEGIIAIMKTGEEAYPETVGAGTTIKQDALGQGDAASAGAWDTGTCTSTNCRWNLLADKTYAVGYTIAAGGADYVIGWADNANESTGVVAAGNCVQVGQGQNVGLTDCFID